jgi:hypothetical protein
LWDRNPVRLFAEGPHRDTHDITLRYKDETENLATSFADFSDLHTAEWYEAVETLPAARELVHTLASALRAEQIGGVFIYKLKPGTQIYPHTDKGWHADFYTKFNICLASNDRAFFGYKDEFCQQHPGDIHMFRNDIPHGVVNGGLTAHIVMVVCLRLDTGYRVPPSPTGWTLTGGTK